MPLLARTGSLYGGMVVSGRKGEIVFTEGSPSDWDYNSSFSPQTPNGGVDVANISGNQASAKSGKWSAAVSAVALDTDRPTGIRFKMQNTTENTWYGLSKTYSSSDSFNNTIRDSTISYGIAWAWTGSHHNDEGGHGVDAQNLPDGFSQDEWIKIIVDPINDIDVKIYNGSGTLKLTTNLTAAFITQITSGNIYAMSDHYSTGNVLLQKIPFT